MTCPLPHTEITYAITLCELGLKTQRLISRSLDHGLLEEVRQLQQIDRELSYMLRQMKRLGNSMYYIWRTQDDAKVRASHAANDDRMFRWEDPPATGHPGEDYNCLCWAEPIGDDQYANQLLISTVNDGEKWSNLDFWL
ncbi:MAG: hypothetical protein KDD76_06615 [Rickettsiales bacterium]|nr:hypothetical protein [Rickettsiales bacterium]